MAVSLVAVAAATNNGVGTSHSFTAPTGMTTGDRLVAVLIGGSGFDFTLSGWTKAFSTNPSIGFEIAVFHKAYASGDNGKTFTAATSGNANSTCFCYARRGVSPATPIPTSGAGGGQDQNSSSVAFQSIVLSGSVNTGGQWDNLFGFSDNTAFTESSGGGTKEYDNVGGSVYHAIFYDGPNGGVALYNANNTTINKATVTVGWNAASPPSNPGAFTNPTAGQVVNTTAAITWGASSDPEGGSLTYDVELTVDNGATWVRKYTGVSVLTENYDFSAETATTTAKVRVRSNSSASGLSSGWTVGPAFTIQHNQAPTAPTPQGPANNSTIDQTIVERFSWLFNDPDAGDYQTQFDLQYRIQGSPSWTTISSTTGNTYYDFAANTFSANTYEWQVRTYDHLGVVSPWSASQFFTAATPPPTPSITSPVSGGTIGQENSQVQWSAPNQGDYQVRRVADNAGAADTNTVYQDSGDVVSSTARNYGLDFSVNNRFEHIQVRVKYSGLWSQWADIRVDVSYTPPDSPSLTFTDYSSDGYNHVHVNNPNPSPGAPTISYNDIYRKKHTDNDTMWVRIATNVLPNTAIDDWTMQSDTDYDYYVRAFGSNGTHTDSPTYTARVSYDSWWLKDPHNPGSNRKVEIQAFPTVQRPVESNVISPLGREDPIVIYGSRKKTKGQFTIQSSTLAERHAIEDMFDELRTLLLQSPSENSGDTGEQWYFAWTDHQQSRIGNTENSYRLLTIPFVEVADDTTDLA